MFCTLVGIFPAEPNSWEFAKNNISNVNGISIQWSSSYSLAPDQDKPDAPMTLIASVTSQEPAKPSDIVSHIQATLTEYIAAQKKGVDNNDKENDNDKENYDNDNYSDEKLTATIKKVECEEWASAPAPLPLKPISDYPDGMMVSVVGEQGGGSTRQSSKHNMMMQQWGMFRHDNLLDGNQVSQLKELVDKAIDSIEDNLSKYQPQVNVGTDNFLFKEIASRSLQRFDLRISTTDDSDIGCLVKEWIWNQPRVQTALSDLLQCSLDDIDYDISVVYSKPGATHQGWHADGKHLDKAKDAGWEELGYQTQLANPYAVCVFVPLIDLNDQVGFTQFWPGSHRSRDFMGFGKVAELTQSTWNGICLAGDSIWYDYRLMHRGMPNTSINTTRPVIQVIFQHKQHMEQDDYNFSNQSVFDGSK